MSNENETLLDLDNFDDLSVDGIEAAPEFIEPPTGRYKLGVTAKIETYPDKETEEEKKRIRFIYDIQEVAELKDSKALIPAVGSLFSETFTVTAEGLKYWKTRSVAILGDLGKATVKEVIETLNGGVSFLADVKTRTSTQKDADGNKREYTNVNVRVISGDQNPPLE